MRRLISFILMMLFINTTGCGFRLRGTSGLSNSALPFKVVYIQHQQNSPTADALRKELSGFTELTYVDRSEAAQVTIHIQNERIDKKVLSINDMGRVNEYRIYLNVNYQVYYQSTLLLENGRFSTFQDYYYTDTNILGKESEEDMLIKNLYQSGANQIIRHTRLLINRHLYNQTPPPALSASATHYLIQQ